MVIGIIGAGVVLALFYGQYIWLTKQMASASNGEHGMLLEQSFERRALADLHAIANQLRFEPGAADAAVLSQALDRAMGEYPELTGLRLSLNPDTTVSGGNYPRAGDATAATRLDEQLLLSYPVVRDETEVGRLSGSFDLKPLHAELVSFKRELEAIGNEERRGSYMWIIGGTITVLLLSGSVIWQALRDHTRRINELKSAAERLRDSDFGEPLPVKHDDELGALARVFNDMRDKLRVTTHSRDYVDSILSGMNEAIIVTSDDGHVERINAATTHLLGYDEQELKGMSIDCLVNASQTRSIADHPPSGLPTEAMFETKYGESIPVSYTCSIVESDHSGRSNRIYAAQNITERRRAEKRIRYLARIDPLTRIPNRMQFQHLLQRAIARARRAGKPLALFYVDIDHFKEINDTFGHLAGDATLETVAERLTAALPEDSVIGRLAGDEFAVIVDGLGPDEDGQKGTRELAHGIIERLADPFFVQGHEVFMTASMGIAYYPKDAPNVIDLIRNADAALYSSKKAGGNMFTFYAPSMNEASVERLMTKSKLKRAFERDELLVHYQPKYNLETGNVDGAEALVRWELPERGLILPSDFIPIAEETSLIIEIGEWVLDKVCEDFRLWQHSVGSPGRVSVNLSLKQLRQANFIKRIGSILRGHEVSPTSLELEITETTLMENPERTISLLDQLYGLGLHLAIDDFGTGYSSLSALQQFPISTLKIDRSFVRDVVTNADDATIVDTIIQMGHNLHMDVVAEGVENEAQLAALQKMGCTYAQGLLFGDPMSGDNYLELLLAQAEGTDSYRALFA
ncbi:MAG: EAL domain-containing protein [Woeseiaceae bacterium]|nr:EAL domain-containing protein [Woeseiaceae bacterium]